MGPPRAKHGFNLSEVSGDIFSAPDGTLIIHACNCLGSWGAGIAAAFKQRYPNAFNVYRNHCKNLSPDELLNTALLIGPMDGSKQHWVGCLFTSKAYGKKKDSPGQILDATTPAMKDLIEQMAEAGGEIKEIRICQINSGLFAVPWVKTKAVLRSIELEENLEFPRDIVVYSLPSK
jgi:ADP-ribose 1''-phosphate phosphatase